MRKFTIFLLLISIWVACKDVYDAPPQALLEVNVQYSNPNVNTIPKISAYGVDQDSIWIYQEQTQTFRLPLRPYDFTSFVLLIDSVADTLTIYHKTVLTYESLESGFYNEHWLDSLEFTANRIDSIAVTDSAITKNWHENIKLYIGPIPTVNN